ncbi:MAG TPA: hypothetical protein VLZ12_07920 [Verrucomicrobiae bacterium]|nr:hypothetical protein [Verrucomicrobiae bacterium]
MSFLYIVRRLHVDQTDALVIDRSQHVIERRVFVCADAELSSLERLLEKEQCGWAFPMGTDLKFVFQLRCVDGNTKPIENKYGSVQAAVLSFQVTVGMSLSKHLP